MRSRWIGALAFTLMMPVGPAPEEARAAETPVQFVRWGPTVPCAYWCASAPILGELPLKARPCENPFPVGSYSDVVTVPAPDLGETTNLHIDIKVNLDWDIYVCAMKKDGGHDGPLVGRVGPIAGRSCDYHSPEVPVIRTTVDVGCFEGSFVGVTPGERYVLRAYNRLDAVPPYGWYRFVSS